jgi:DNA-binding NarL/FixJ family response regulator
LSHKMIDCSRVSGDIGCTLTILGREDEVVEAATAHAIVRHGHQDSPRLRETIQAELEDAEPHGWLHGEVTTSDLGSARRSVPTSSAARPLTGRQRELLRLVAGGHDNIAIARQLGLSPGTVRKHLENAFARLGVSSRTAAIAKLYGTPR